MTEPLLVCWVDGQLRPRAEAAVGVDDSAFTEGRGCYTSARVTRGRPTLVERHLRRLLRGAHALGLLGVDAAALRRAFQELARAAFGEGDGVVRLQLSRGGDGALHVTGVPRGLGPDAPTWRAITAPFPHPGAVVGGGHKLTNRLPLALAADAAREAGVEEALLFDAAGRLVEGARSNVVVQLTEGLLCTPPVGRGGVAGVALEAVAEKLGDLRWRDLPRAAVLDARAVVALNAVRGARALESLDGKPLGSEGPELARRLDAAIVEPAVR